MRQFETMTDLHFGPTGKFEALTDEAAGRFDRRVLKKIEASDVMLERKEGRQAAAGTLVSVPRAERRQPEARGVVQGPAGGHRRGRTGAQTGR
jgi:hypothetical protein